MPFICAAVFIGAAYAAWCYFTNLGIPCLFQKLTGLCCPGCGTGRMINALLRFDLEAAFRYNEAVFLMLPVLVLIGLDRFVGYLKTGSAQLRGFERRIITAAAFLLVIFGLLRNISGFEFLLPPGV
ncbi:MAG: DUF2752 domain-containing protein [Oscillospiraceae bacterium]